MSLIDRDPSPIDGQKKLRRAAERLGVSDPRVLDAVAATPRRLFAPDHLKRFAYDDRPLPIGAGQTLSQPSLVALMTEKLRLSGHERVLEIGSGSGYQTALLCQLSAHVYAIERLAELAEPARARLDTLGLTNVSWRVGDGALGWPEEAPFDRILTAAAAPEPPEALIRQLAPGGLLLGPFGPLNGPQRLLRFSWGADGLETETFGEVRFVPLISDHD